MFASVNIHLTPKHPPNHHTIISSPASQIHIQCTSKHEQPPPKEKMASSGVLPWLVGLSASDTVWDAVPAPPRHDTRPAPSVTCSPKSEPGTLRSRVQDTCSADGTVNRRAQSSSPIKQPSLAWRSRLINGQTTYGDQTDLFGPSGLENIFARNQAADSTCSQKKQRAAIEKITTDHGPGNLRETKPAFAFGAGLSVYDDDDESVDISSGAFALTYHAKRNQSKRSSENASPTSQSSQSSVAEMLTEMMGKMNELSDSNKGYQTRMQAIKERLNESEELRHESEELRQRLEKSEREKQQSSEELRQRLEQTEREKQQAKSSVLYQKGQADKGSAELLKAQRKLFDFAKQTVSAERRADWAKSERRQLAEDYNMSKRALSHMREDAEEWREKYEGAQAELESLRSSSPKSAECEVEAESPKSEIVTRQPQASPLIDDESLLGSMIRHNNSKPEATSTGAGAERNTEPTQHIQHHTTQLADETQDATASRSVTESELEDLTPVFISKRTNSAGGVSFNAIRSDNATRNEIFKQRKEIDKTETSQRVREIELAMGTEQSDIDEDQQSTPNCTKVPNKIMGTTDPSIADVEDDSEWMGSRHVSGFTDAPEVEEDMPVQAKQAELSGDWDFTEPPQNESSELVAAHHNNGESPDRRSVSFGLQQLNDYAFKMVDQALEDATDVTMEETDGAQFPTSSNPVKDLNQSRDSSPAPDVQAPGSRMPFEFRKESLSEIHSANTKAKRASSNSTQSWLAAASHVSLPRTRPSPKQVSPPQAKRRQGPTHIDLPKTRSPPQVFVEDTDGVHDSPGAPEGKRPLPRSPLKSPTPKRRRTLHDSELLQSVSDANVSYHSQLQEAIGSRTRNDARNGENQNTAKPSVLAHRKMAKARSATPSQGPATKDYINEAKKVIELLRGNVTSSSPLGGITEADENETYEAYEEAGAEPYAPYSTHRSDNMRTLAPQQVAHLIGGEVHGMTFDRMKNCWIRSKSSEHKQFLDPRDALSSDDDPFREISDLTVDKSVQIRVTQPSLELGATTVVHHELDGTRHLFGRDGFESEREDTPQQSTHENLKLPGEDTTLAHYDDVHESDPSEITPTPDPSTTDPSTSVQLPSQITFPSPPNKLMPIEIARLRISTPTSNANINNTFQLSDLPEFTVHEEDHERPSERALALRLAAYAAVKADDPYTVVTTELVKAITDVQGSDIYWDDLTSLCLRDKSLKSLHNLDAHCTRVEKLDVSSNALIQLDGIPSFVRQLNASSNQLVSLTSWAHLMHLQYLDISNNNLESLDGLGHLIHLRELRVDNNRVRKLDGISDLDGLITLSARNNVIGEVNLEHFRFGRVVDLDLSDNQISSIRGLEGMSSLRTLKLNKNPMSQAFSVTTAMPRLKHLSLSSCGLMSLDVTHFPHLRTLEVDNNSLTSIAGLGELKKLDLLSMCAQDLEGGEPIRIFETPMEAQTIRLSCNTIPFLLINQPFMSVKHLELSDTGLVFLPSEFGIKLPNLRTLDLSYNGLRDIRPLAPLSGLVSLKLTGCRIERLRKTVATMGKFEKLLKLDMKDNPLTQGFYGPETSEDKVYKGKLDEDTAIRRRTYELLVAYSCRREGFMLDGLVFDAKAAVAKDQVWERLVDLGVLRQVS
jgi:Leucine-rich repeat (LRR) protein